MNGGAVDRVATLDFLAACEEDEVISHGGGGSAKMQARSRAVRGRRRGAWHERFAIRRGFGRPL